MVEVRMKENFFIEPQYLNQKFQTVVEETIKKNKCKTCNKKYGFIKDVKDVKILNNIISMNNANVITTVEYTAITEKPCIGKLYTSTKILFNNQKQLLVDVDGIFSVLISNCMFENNLCKFKTCSCVFDLSFQNIDNINLTVVEFKEGKFMTIGDHVH